MNLRSTPVVLAFTLSSTLALVGCGNVNFGTRPSSPSSGDGMTLRTQAVMSTLYASPSGSGSTCSSGSPCSLTGARDRVRGMNGNMSGDIEVNLFGGTYALNSTLELTSSDSGSNGHQVIWQAASNATPIISGGQQITNWSLFDSTKNIYRASVGTLRFRQLYIGGARVTRARAPNLTDAATGGPYYTVLNTSYPYTVNASETGNWQNLNQVEFVWRSHWIHKRARVASFTAAGSSVKVNFLSPEKDSQLTPKNNEFGYYHFENAYELLDAEGEWYLNTSDNFVYYKPKVGQNMSSIEVIAPKVETLVALTGTSSQPVQNITFKGITFRYDNWLLPNNVGFIDVQASLGIDDGTALPNINYSFLPSMVLATYGQQLRFEENRFEKSGAHGLGFKRRTNGNVVTGNVFSDISANGISFWCQEPPENAFCTNDIVSNNLIDGYGQAYSGSVGIFMGQTTLANIVHNEVKSGFYSGISFGWDFGDTETRNRDNQIQYNKIHDIMSIHDDGAGIYSLGRMDNTRFHHNYVFGLNRSVYQGSFPIAGIYMDNGSSFKFIDSNVVDVNPTNAFYAVNPPNHDNLFKDNFYTGPFGNISANTSTNNINSITSPAAIEIMNCAGIEAAFGGSVPTTCPSGLAVIGNFASGALGSASSSVEGYGWGISKANDTERNSVTNSNGWTSDSNLTTNHTESLQFDLGSSKAVERVDIFPRNDAGNIGENFPIDFTLQTSLDGTTWTTAITRTGYAKPSNAVQSFGFSSRSARYVKWVGTNLRPNPNDANRYRMALAEFEIYSTGGVTPTNWVLGSGISSSSSVEGYGWGRARINDTERNSVSTSNGWTSDSNLTIDHTETLQIDFGSSKPVARVDIYPRNDSGNIGENFPIDFTLQVSNDGTTWTTVITRTGFAKPSNTVQTFSFTSQNARFLKWVGTNLRPNSTDANRYRMSAAEIEAYTQ